VCHTEGDPINADWDFFALLSKNGKAGYIDSETALNRSHDDGVRATNSLNAQEKIRYRFASLERIWRADSSFMEAHGDEVNKVESRLWLRMAKYSYFQNDLCLSRSALREYWQRGGDEGKATARLLEVLNCIPWSGPVMSKLLDLRQ
jgi:hypothetical protein